MAHEIEFYGSLCSVKKFIINGIKANDNDFGYQFDASPETAEDYSCGNRVFEHKPFTEDVLNKYGIDELEYWTIANKLAEGLSFGCCGLCS